MNFSRLIVLARPTDLMIGFEIFSSTILLQLEYDLSGYLAVANKQAQIMTKAAVEMGFTPASRSRVSVPLEEIGELDPWADIAG
jgi:hypothetical protein